MPPRPIAPPGTRPGLEGDAVPNIARVYDYWLGGGFWYEADRMLAEKMMRIDPATVQICRDNRAFLTRSVTWAAWQGIRQFLDLGSGLPTIENTHETAREAAPGARVLYVDFDEVVLAACRALLEQGGVSGVAAASADLRDPDAVLDLPEARQLIGLSEPVCVILAAVVQFMTAAEAREVIHGYVRRLAPGSCVLVTTGHTDDHAAFENVRAGYTAGVLTNHSRQDLESFLDGLEIVPPGVVHAREWHPGWDLPSRPSPKSSYLIAGAGVKAASRPR